VKTALCALAIIELLAGAAGANGIGFEYALGSSDAVVVGSVQSVTPIRELQEWGGFRIMIYRATIRPTSIDGFRTKLHRICYYFASPAPHPSGTIERCPPFVEMTVGQQFIVGGVLKEIQGVGRVLWVPSGDYTRPR
jgi:hypothetical protein